MKDIHEISINDFLDELGSSSPAPGGGSVAALSGALGAGLVSMLCSLTIGRPKFAEYEEFARETLEHSNMLKNDLLDCLTNDMKAYDSVIEAIKLPKDNPDRTEKLQASYKIATQAPQNTINKCFEVMKTAKSLVGRSNPSAKSDLLAAGIQARSGILIAMDSINANLSVIKDSEYVSKIREWAENILIESENLLREIQEGVK